MEQIKTTVTPDNPAKDFNDWQQHIQKLRHPEAAAEAIRIEECPTYFLYIQNIS